MVRNKKYIQLFFIVVLPVYFYIGYNSIINRHTHFYPNGIVITHSHPVDRKSKEAGIPINQHHHTSTEVCLFYSSQSDKFIIPAKIQLADKPNEKTHKYLIVNDTTVIIKKGRKLPPRSPPYSI